MNIYNTYYSLNTWESERVCQCYNITLNIKKWEFRYLTILLLFKDICTGCGPAFNSIHAGWTMYFWKSERIWWCYNAFIVVTQYFFVCLVFFIFIFDWIYRLNRELRYICRWERKTYWRTHRILNNLSRGAIICSMKCSRTNLNNLKVKILYF